MQLAHCKLPRSREITLYFWLRRRQAILEMETNWFIKYIYDNPIMLSYESNCQRQKYQL